MTGSGVPAWIVAAAASRGQEPFHVDRRDGQVVVSGRTLEAAWHMPVSAPRLAAALGVQVAAAEVDAAAQLVGIDVGPGSALLPWTVHTAPMPDLHVDELARLLRHLHDRVPADGAPPVVQTWPADVVAASDESAALLNRARMLVSGVLSRYESATASASLAATHGRPAAGSVRRRRDGAAVLVDFAAAGAAPRVRDVGALACFAAYGPHPQVTMETVKLAAAATAVQLLLECVADEGRADEGWRRLAALEGADVALFSVSG